MRLRSDSGFNWAGNRLRRDSDCLPSPRQVPQQPLAAGIPRKPGGNDDVSAPHQHLAGERTSLFPGEVSGHAGARYHRLLQRRAPTGGEASIDTAWKIGEEPNVRARLGRPRSR